MATQPGTGHGDAAATLAATGAAAASPAHSSSTAAPAQGNAPLHVGGGQELFVGADAGNPQDGEPQDGDPQDGGQRGGGQQSGGAQQGSSQTARSEEHTSELQSLMRISYAVFCLKKKKNTLKIKNKKQSLSPLKPSHHAGHKQKTRTMKT